MQNNRKSKATAAPRARRAASDLTLLERVVERSDIKVDVAACIRWLCWGLSTLLLATAILIDHVSDKRDAVGGQHSPKKVVVTPPNLSIMKASPSERKPSASKP
ncbi:hypothetical protein [Sphingopyxis sp. YR583]|uniref:hypothetical protein n=1 Tax=Sphingopyxis sp. YR583 TaxID=1881047 RepID=UPI00115FC12A|nr:hypothetical protein [Sphingopyxis sp. YR583]